MSESWGQIIHTAGIHANWGFAYLQCKFRFLLKGKLKYDITFLYLQGSPIHKIMLHVTIFIHFRLLWYKNIILVANHFNLDFGTIWTE